MRAVAPPSKTLYSQLNEAATLSWVLGASADERACQDSGPFHQSGEGDCPFPLEGPFSESTIGSTQHELPLTNPMGEVDAGASSGCGILR
jgi:hypothetical protein